MNQLLAPIAQPKVPIAPIVEKLPMPVTYIYGERLLDGSRKWRASAARCRVDGVARCCRAAATASSSTSGLFEAATARPRRARGASSRGRPAPDAGRRSSRDRAALRASRPADGRWQTGFPGDGVPRYAIHAIAAGSSTPRAKQLPRDAPRGMFRFKRGWRDSSCSNDAEQL